MPNTFEMYQLIAPLIRRTNISNRGARNQLTDRFAEYILLLLKNNPKTRHVAQNPPTTLLGIKDDGADWEWIDRKLLWIFQQYPHATGIEIECGLSTRFHRLSARLDWPRFSWFSVNSLAVNECVKMVFPQIDNFVSIGCANPKQEWTNLSSLQNINVPVCIIGDQTPIENWESFISFYRSILGVLDRDTSKVFLIITHRIKGFSSLCETHCDHSFLLDTYTKKNVKKQIVWRLCKRLNIARANQELSQTHFIKIENLQNG